jgi:hypothetical protein
MRLNICKGGWAANKFCESQIHNLVEIIFKIYGPFAMWPFFDLHTKSFFCVMQNCYLCIHNLWTQALFANLKLLQVRKYILFLFTNIEYNALVHVCTKKIFWKKDDLYKGLFWDRVVQYFVKICGISMKICKLLILWTSTPKFVESKNLRLCNLWTLLHKYNNQEMRLRVERAQPH